MNKPKFRNTSDYIKSGAALGLAYAPYAGLLFVSGGAPLLLQTGAIIAGMFATLKLPYVRRVPLGIAEFVTKRFIARDVSPAPEKLQSVVDGLCKDAGAEKVHVYVYEKGITNNALALGNKVFVGRKLMDRLDEKELKFVLAHEISHVRTQDYAEGYLSWPPYINSIITGISIGAGVFSALAAGALSVPLGAGVVAGAYGYYQVQRALHKYSSRVMEYRADRNAMNLTKDFNSAVSALRKISPHDMNRKPSTMDRIFTSHPIGQDRVDNLKSSFDEAVKGEKVEEKKAAKPQASVPLVQATSYMPA